MEDIAEDELRKKLPGRYAVKGDGFEFLMFLEGGCDSPAPFGDSSSLMFIEHHSGGGGRSQSITGPYRLQDGRLVLEALRISQDSWTPGEESEGEAFVQDYKKGPITAEIQVEAEAIKLKLRVFNKDVELVKGL